MSDNGWREWMREIDQKIQPGPPIRVVVQQRDGSHRLGYVAAAKQDGDAVEMHIVMDEAGADAAPFDHVWWWRSRLPERKGQRCRVRTRGSKNNVLVEFDDGEMVVTSRYAVRRIKDA